MILLGIGIIIIAIVLFLQKDEIKLPAIVVTTEKIAKIVKFVGFIIRYSNEKQLDPILTCSVIAIESGGNPKAYRDEPHINDGSIGLMQIIFGTAKSVGYSGTNVGLYDPETNIKYGTKYLSKCYLSEKGDVYNTFRAYNGGTTWRKSSAKALKMTETHANKGIAVYNYLKKEIKL